MDALDFSDLSEDWVSQPRSSDPPEIKDEKALRSSIRSKIPVPLRRSVSSTQNVLHEKSASDVNAERPRSREILPEAFSGTIQHHDAAKVMVGKQGTPEWRKRLLQANGKSQDLFSPIGLAGVFKPPTIKSQTPQASRSQESAVHSDVPPSSPPVMRRSGPQDTALASPEDSLQLPPLRAPSQTGPRHGTRRRNPSAVSSNKSALNHERFSPVVFGGKRTVSRSQSTSNVHSSRYASREMKRSLSSMSDSVLELPAPLSDNEIDSVSLPEYSELDSEQINLDSKFITTRRGGFSRDGSFKVRPLTPSSYQPGLLSSLPASDLPTAPMAPLTPAKAISTLDEDSPQRQKSSGSPLKLFDKYDTFTNDRFNRRISQFESTKEEEEDLSDNSLPQTPSPRKGQALRRRQRMSSFGEGELDKFDFTHQNEQDDIPRWPTNSRHGETNDDKLRQSLEDPFNEDDTQIILHSSFEDYNEAQGVPEEYNDRDTKRASSSRYRVPDPKRRRTDNQDPESDEELEVLRQRPIIRSTSSMAGKKRKDARRGDHSVAANPEILAGRQILDPVSPFRRLSRTFSKALGSEEPHYIDVNAATDILANELASLALTVAEDVTQGTRKKSVTTADFFKEAHLIMQHIRTKAAQSNQLPFQAQQTSPETQPLAYKDELFSNDDLDRPASREGASLPRKRNPTLDKRVVSHLKKFADSDDLGLAINSSFNVSKLHEHIQDHDLDSYKSDPSDIRILEPRQHSKGDSEDGQCSTGNTNSTGGTNISIPTGSSGTRNKAIIELHKVSHLLNDNMGCMTFDHQRQLWIKRKSSGPEQKHASRLASEMTEEDPFAGIPDLDDHIVESHEGQASSRPTTGYTQRDPVLASSGPAIETRATSWSTSHPNNSTLTAQERRKEHMIEAALLHQGSSAASQTSSLQPRAVTVAFSSPPIRSSTPVSEEAEQDHIESVETPNEDGWSTEAHRIRLRNNLSSSVVKYTPRPLSRIDEMENSLESLDSSPSAPRNMSLQIVTPAPRPETNGLLVPATGNSYVTMQLTPLPDFTIHQMDQSLNLDVQYVAQKQGLSNHDQIEGRFSISIKELVAKIADIEPYEPYWEYMKELDLSKNRLFTLHMLDEFCSRIESLNVDYNELGQLNGAPELLRMLSARNNCLSKLTAWDHLQNLQYLDVSGNDLDSLKGFGNLFHLRELKAENNRIQSLDGVTHLDGLLKLGLANNCISAVDLSESRLSRLEVLNLSSNNISKVQGLESLISLQRLNLRKNNLITIYFSDGCTHQSLKHLDIANNNLTSLEVTPLHGLRDLIIDFNSIMTIKGLKERSNIERVSWRYQRFDASSPQSFRSPIDYSCCSELRSLNLSGNRLLEFSLAERFLNLERLDLASCGIRRLSHGFGTSASSLRLLNLNHNALREIQPLEGIKGLNQLFLVNNRLKDFRQVIDVVCNLGKRLQVLDCRNNPFNAGYYLTTKENAMQLATVSKEQTIDHERDPFNDETFMMPDANIVKDEAYLQQIDFGTSTRRRVYELLLSQRCNLLKKVDGMALNKDRLENKDRVWKRLRALGIVQASHQNV